MPTVVGTVLILTDPYSIRMDPLWVGLALLAGLVAIVLWRRRARRQPQRGGRPVLPAQYSSLLQADHSRYPELCSSCGTENTAGYDFCQECGDRLPDGTRARTDVDVSDIFEK
ncbi:hypothetical protein Hmuk_2772 [Halomicrobium mukohataei DSM 12286]|uniref:DUF7577 domain-containing protein n=2 Tax=Halomicrobium mukohataei TaxID=57705 RepID=C7P085_HALMD|nr:hypothetical protein Hmuk_2772 [Halomicrobium mukohataei DSM 12286]